MSETRRPGTRSLPAQAFLCALCLVCGAAVAAPPRPVLTRDQTNQRDWTVHLEIRIRPSQFRVARREALPPDLRIIMDSFEFYFPLLDGSAMHEAYRDRAKSDLRLDTRPLTGPPRLTAPTRVESGYQGLSHVLVWSVGPVNTSDVWFLADIPMTCWETRIDEARARAHRWPRAEWAAELALCLQPQAFVESADSLVEELVARWAGREPLSRPPYELAKGLAAEVLNFYNVTEPDTSSFARGPFLGQTNAVIFPGMRVNGAAAAARLGRGPPGDLACLLTAVWRAAGIPARLVIGLDIQRSLDERFPAMRVWAEFFLPRQPAPDPKAPPDSLPLITPADGEWIPVDITRQKSFSSRAPPMNQRWQYFGHNEEFDFVAPIAFHYLPPKDGVNLGPPGLWSWFPQPANPAADAAMTVSAMETPRRGDDPPRNRAR